MAQKTMLASQITIKLDGVEVPRPLMQNLVSVLVDQHCHLPDMFAICFTDSEMKLLDNGPFNLTKEIEIGAETADERHVALVKGEITSLEPDFQEGMIAQLVVRGYDKSHRLYRQTKSKAYLNKKDSDLAQEIARNLGLQTDIDVTGTVYDHIYQDNQSDLAFLMGRAYRIGYECFVADGKLHFCKPSSGSAAMTLTWGDDLLSFRPRLSLAEQVDEVVVKGWDIEKQQAIVGRARRGGLYPKIGDPKDGAGWAAAFGKGKLVIVDQPVVSQAEADILAAARLDELSGAYIEAEGEALRRPDILAGRMVQLEALGTRLSGVYLVTQALHAYTAAGLTTTFQVRGARTGFLLERLQSQRSPTQWPGVVSAIVTNSDDPRDWGRVKVKFPWMADDAESDWARVVAPGAGSKAGFCALPAVGDEVAVAFAHGNFGEPFVLGGLWNGKQTVPAEVGAAARGEKPLVRSWRSRSGHVIAVHDNGDNKIEIITAGGNRLVLDDAKRTLTIESKNDLVVKASGNMKLEAGGNMDLKASGTMTVKGTRINLN